MANELIDLNELLSALMDLARDVEDNYKEQLAASGRYTTNYGLIDSVRTQVVANGQGYDVTMNLNHYWKYVENGTKPHFPPPEKILEWIEIKPIFPRPIDGKRIPTPKQLAYLISRKIAREGTEGSQDLEKTKNAIIPFYYERISAALGRDVERYIGKVLAGKQ